MEAFIEANEPVIRLVCFGGVFAVMALWELVAPRRPLAQSKIVRWSSNLGIVVVNTVLVRLLFPVAAMGVAVLAEERGWGLLNTVEWTSAAAVIVSVVALDFAIYLQHVMFHAVPALWRLHRMHHADLDFDVTTGLRIHPVEIILSILIKMAAIAVLGPPVVAVLIFEVVLNATSMFNHGNVRLPGAIDRPLRWLVVTPDMHRVHHSVVAAENELELRLQSSVVGSPVRHLPGAAGPPGTTASPSVLRCSAMPPPCISIACSSNRSSARSAPIRSTGAVAKTTTQKRNPMRHVDAWTGLLAALALTACQASTEDIHVTFDRGAVRIGGNIIDRLGIDREDARTIAGKSMEDDRVKAYNQALLALVTGAAKPDDRFPVIVYAHGCAGMVLASREHVHMLERLGDYVVVAPDSFARKRPVTCWGPGAVDVDATERRPPLKARRVSPWPWIGWFACHGSTRTTFFSLATVKGAGWPWTIPET